MTILKTRSNIGADRRRRRFPRTTRLRAAILLLAIPFLLGCDDSDGDPVSPTCEDPFANEQVSFSLEPWTQTDFCQHSVPFAGFLSAGGLPEDKPPIDDPAFVAVDRGADFLGDESPLVAVEIGGQARAYPLSVLVWHEIVNDVVAGEALAITYCPLCNTSVVYGRSVDGKTLRFGLTRNLRNSNLVMFDDRTESWWQQFDGEALVGAFTGKRLEVVPSRLISLGVFATLYPDGLVATHDTGFERDYGSTPYVGYDAGLSLFMFDGIPDARLRATERVLAGTVGGVARAYPYELLREQGVVNDGSGADAVVAFYQPGMTSTTDRATIDDAADVGMAALYARSLNGETLEFERDPEGVIRDQQTSSTWDVGGRAIDGPLQGSQLELLPAATHFWFVWAAFTPETEIRP